MYVFQCVYVFFVGYNYKNEIGEKENRWHLEHNVTPCLVATRDFVYPLYRKTAQIFFARFNVFDIQSPLPILGSS